MQIIETELSVVKQVRKANLLKQRGLSIDLISRDPIQTSYRGKSLAALRFKSS
jgi:hypothetical protein